MFIFDIIRFIIAFPFIIFIVLKLSKIPLKQSYLIVSPLYFWTFIELTKFVFPKQVSIVVFIYLLFIFTLSYIVVKKEYRSVHINQYIRKIMYIFARLFIVYYIIVSFIGILK